MNKLFGIATHCRNLVIIILSLASKSTTSNTHNRQPQGNISNRDKSQSQKGKQPKKRKSSTVEEQPQRRLGRADAKSKVSAPVAEEPKPAKRRVSPRLESLTTVTEKSLGKEITSKSSKTNETLPSKERSTKKGGIKRSSTDGDNAAQQRGRSTKRTKKSSEAETVAEPVLLRRSTRSRSQSLSASSRGMNIVKKSTERRAEEVAIIPAGDNRVVPQDFGLERSSFKRDNFTYGIAYYDATERSDPLLCKDYVTDMFQQLYYAEVSSCSRSN